VPELEMHDVFLAATSQAEEEDMTKHDADNHANQLNPEHDAFWESRGWDERPDDWEERVEEDATQPESK
jgi:hypothetical protein